MWRTWRCVVALALTPLLVGCPEKGLEAVVSGRVTTRAGQAAGPTQVRVYLWQVSDGSGTLPGAESVPAGECTQLEVGGGWASTGPDGRYRAELQARPLGPAEVCLTIRVAPRGVPFAGVPDQPGPRLRWRSDRAVPRVQVDAVLGESQS